LAVFFILAFFLAFLLSLGPIVGDKLGASFESFSFGAFRGLSCLEATFSLVGLGF
jgi:hypothetical protein